MPGVVEKDPEKTEELYNKALDEGMVTFNAFDTMLSFFKKELNDQEKAVECANKIKKKFFEMGVRAAINISEKYPDLFSPPTTLSIQSEKREEVRLEPYSTETAAKKLADLQKLLKAGLTLSETIKQDVRNHLPPKQADDQEDEVFKNLRKIVPDEPSASPAKPESKKPANKKGPSMGHGKN